jgi:hypothetical protein
MTTDHDIDAEGRADAIEAAREFRNTHPIAADNCGPTGAHHAGYIPSPLSAGGAVPYTPAPCSCASCGGECGGSNDPAHGSCGPLADVDGRPICESCRELAQVWGDYRVGVKVSTDQDRVRVRVAFGESAWLDPVAARHLAAVLADMASALDRSRAEAARAEAEAAQVLAPQGVRLMPCPVCECLPSLITGGGQAPRVGPSCGHAEARIYPIESR